jgi:hypothetical protein
VSQGRIVVVVTMRPLRREHKEGPDLIVRLHP